MHACSTPRLTFVAVGDKRTISWSSLFEICVSGLKSICWQLSMAYPVSPKQFSCMPLHPYHIFSMATNRTFSIAKYVPHRTPNPLITLYPNLYPSANPNPLILITLTRVYLQLIVGCWGSRIFQINWRIWFFSVKIKKMWHWPCGHWKSLDT